MSKRYKILIIFLVCIIAVQGVLLFSVYKDLRNHVEEEKQAMSLHLRSSIGLIEQCLDGNTEYADDLEQSVYSFYFLYNSYYRKTNDNLTKIHRVPIRLSSTNQLSAEEYVLLKTALEAILEDIDSPEGFDMLTQFTNYSNSNN